MRDNLFLTKASACGTFCTMNHSEFQSRNLRFLLWKRLIKRDHWILEFANRLNLDHKEAERILLKGGLNSTQLGIVSNYFCISEEDILFKDFVTEVNILRENLKFLIDSLEHGGRKKLARDVGVDVTTITRWAKGKNPPDQGNLNRLANSLQISSAVDLTQEPIFLELNPVIATEKRRWLLDAIEKLDTQTLNEFFPALRKMLGD
jgi:transcriptional regulator with XRE-family HTH domain